MGADGRAQSRWARRTFLVLFAMNLLDYIDRWTLASVLPEIQADLRINNIQAGWLATLFLISYSLISPVMGYAGDRVRRTWLLGLGVGVWSLATVATGFAHTYGQLQWARAFLGIGEATYGVIAPAVLMDLFARDVRSRSKIAAIRPTTIAMTRAIQENRSNHRSAAIPAK